MNYLQRVPFEGCSVEAMDRWAKQTCGGWGPTEIVETTVKRKGEVIARWARLRLIDPAKRKDQLCHWGWILSGGALVGAAATYAAMAML